ncbi:MAG: GNAT family N-acetyltransferase [Acidobacteriota bacterium]
MTLNPPRVHVLDTERLRLVRLSTDHDLDFIVQQLNEPSFLENIGDRGVRNVDDARRYLLEGPLASYEQFGFGLFLVQLASTGESMGTCGLLKRDSLEDVDIGFAFLPSFWGRGYAVEAAKAVLNYGVKTHGLKRVVGITQPSNAGSIRVLEGIGLRYERMVRMPGEDSDIRLYGYDVPA